MLPSRGIDSASNVSVYRWISAAATIVPAKALNRRGFFGADRLAKLVLW